MEINLSFLKNKYNKFNWDGIIKICQNNNFTVKTWEKITSHKLNSNQLIKIIEYYFNDSKEEELIEFLKKFIDNDTNFLIEKLSINNFYLDYLILIWKKNSENNLIDLKQLISYPFVFKTDISKNITFPNFILVTLPRIVKFNKYLLPKIEPVKNLVKITNLKQNNKIDFMELQIEKLNEDLLDLKKMFFFHKKSTEKSFKIIEKRILKLIELLDT